MENLAKRIGQRLRAERRRRGLSQAGVSALTGVHMTAISHFETGRQAPSAANLRALSVGMGVSADYLLDIIPPNDPDPWLERFRLEVLSVLAAIERVKTGNSNQPDQPERQRARKEEA